jgi:hypothetical protein
MGNIRKLTEEYNNEVKVLRNLKINSPEFVKQMQICEDAHKNLKLYFSRYIQEDK